MLLLFTIILLLGFVSLFVAVFVGRTDTFVFPTPSEGVVPTTTTTPHVSTSVTVSPQTSPISPVISPVVLIEDTFDNATLSQKLVTFPANVPTIGRWSQPSYAEYTPVIPATSDYCRGFPNEVFSYAQVTDMSAYDNKVNTLNFDTTATFPSSIIGSMFAHSYQTLLAKSDTEYISCGITYTGPLNTMNVVIIQYNLGVYEEIGNYEFPAPIFETEIRLVWSITPDGAIQAYLNSTLVKSVNATTLIPKNDSQLKNAVLYIIQSGFIGPTIQYTKISTS